MTHPTACLRGFQITATASAPQPVATTETPRTGRHWLKVAAEYATPSPSRSIWQLGSNLAMFVVAWWAMLNVIEVSFWLVPPIMLLGGAMLTRLFIIQHDCGHGAFFKSSRANDWVGRFLGAITIIPYDFWKRNHATHHATSGNLSKRGVGDIGMLSVREYLARSARGRRAYRIYRHPAFLVLVAANLYFLVKLRSPWGQAEAWRKAAPSILSTNVLILCWMVPLILTVGWADFLLVFLPMQCGVNSLGLWLFYIQHQYEDAYWEWSDEWDFHEASLRGSSHYDLPPLLRWYTGNIGAHHVHHLCSKVPNYRLYECLRANEELWQLNRITIAQSLPAARLALWDEDTKRMISFRQLRERQPAA